MKKHEIKSVDGNLPVSILKQGEYFVAYTPALDISTYGKTIEEAQRNFSELIAVFFSEFDDERTLGNVLESLGWTKNRSDWTPPVEVKHLQQPFTMPSFA
jgi:predicted RNase H-like HicB family nuclease